MPIVAMVAIDLLDMAVLRLTLARSASLAIRSRMHCTRGIGTIPKIGNLTTKLETVKKVI